MRHPLEWVPVNNRKPLLWGLLVAFVLIILIFQYLNGPAGTPAAPAGVISLQLAATPANAEAMLESWDASARLFVAFGLGLDYLFMPVYALAVAIGALLAASRHPGRFARLGAWAAYAAFLAALLDGLENFGQFLELFHGRTDLAPVIAIAASLKFSLLLLGILYGLVGWVWRRE